MEFLTAFWYKANFLNLAFRGRQSVFFKHHMKLGRVYPDLFFNLDTENPVKGHFLEALPVLLTFKRVTVWEEQKYIKETERVLVKY